MISAIILSGGHAARMNGLNKGLVPLYSTPLINFVIAKLKDVTDDLMISANRDIPSYEAYGYPVVSDQIRNENGEQIGPLGGFHAGLSAAKHAFVLFAPCDMPNLPPNLASRLMRTLQETKAEICVVTADGDTIPVLCICKKSVLPSLAAYIAQGGRKVSIWQKSLVYAECDLSNTFTYNAKGEVIESGGDFTNLNSLQDIADYE